MTYEKPEALEIGAAEEIVLGVPKRIGADDEEQLPKFADAQVAELCD